MLQKNNLIIGFVFLCYNSISIASPTVGDHALNASKADYQASMVIWLDGAISGFLSSNAELIYSRKSKPLFCLPKGKTINSAGAMRLINFQLKVNKWNDWTPLGIVLLKALQDSYPCL